MKTIKGPGIYLAQFVRDEKPFNCMEDITDWAVRLGYKGLQLPSWDVRLFNLDLASESKDYCDDYKGKLARKGMEIIEVAGYLQGQVMAIHPAYHELFQPFYPVGLSESARVEWATEQLIKVIKASHNFGTKNVSVLSGGFAWPFVYPWPQRPEGFIEEAFQELAKRWYPVLQYAHEKGITIGFELHPGSDLYDGATYEMFLEHTNNHPAACITYDPSHFLLQQMDYLEFIRIYGERIKCFHVKDAEFRANGRVGVYGGYQPWNKRAGRFRSLGDGQVDFKQVFTLLTEAGYDGWAVLEWECCVKSPEQGAKEGALFIKEHIIQACDVAFDDFAGGQTNRERNRRILGIDQ